MSSIDRKPHALDPIRSIVVFEKSKTPKKN